MPMAPDILGGMQQGAALRGEILRQQAMQQQMGRQQAIAPYQLQQQQLATQKKQAEFERFTDRANLESMAQGAYEFLQIKDPAQQQSYLENRLQEIQSRGGDPRDTQEALAMPPEQRQVAAQNVMKVAERFGVIPRDVAMQQNIKKQKTGAFLVKDATGQTQIAVGSYDPKTGQLQTEMSGLEGYEPVSKLGETPGEETERKITQKRGEAAATGEEKRASELITRGIAAAESTANIRRAINLLDQVKTGGFAAVALRAKQTLGIEGGDEGELSNSLGKAVLSQLRETFGAAFTENEGKRLERIEANFSKSPATNKRLLEQALRIAERTAKRAKEAALKRGDKDTAADIDDLLSFSLSEAPPAAAAKQTRTKRKYNPATGRIE